MHLTSFVRQSVSLAVRVASKCLPERLTDYIGTLVAVRSSSPRSPPPRFYSSLYDNPVSYDPTQDPYIKAFYGDTYPESRKQADAPQFASSSQRAEKIFNELLPAPPAPVSVRRVSSKSAAEKRNTQLLKARKREAIRLCSSPERLSALLASNMPDKDKKVIFKLAKMAVKEKFLSKRFSDKPSSKDQSDKMAELGGLSTLPALERFSTSMGLHGATTIGKGVRMDGLSYGRRRGIVGKPEHVPAVPPTIKRVSEAASESPVQPRKELSMVSTVRATPRINQKPQLVVRSGREDWGRKVE